LSVSLSAGGGFFVGVRKQGFGCSWGEDLDMGMDVLSGRVTVWIEGFGEAALEGWLLKGIHALAMILVFSFRYAGFD